MDKTGSCGPCLGCEERYLACHDDCERYKAWTDERRKVLDARKEYKQMLELQFSGFAKSRIKHYRKIRY